MAKLFFEAEIRKIEERQIVNYQYSDSTISTDSMAPPTPQSHTVSSSPQAQDLSSSGFQQNSRENELFDFLRFQQTTISTINSQQQQNSAKAAQPPLQPRYFETVLLQAVNEANNVNEAKALVIQNLY